MAFTLQDLAHQVGGTVEGDGRLVLQGVAGLEDAEPGQISFLADSKYGAAMAATRASAVIVAEDWQGSAPCALLRVAQPNEAFTKVYVLFAPPPVEFAPGVHPTAIVADGVTLGNGVSIGPYCVIRPGARIGDRTVLCAHCYVGDRSCIGKDGLIHPFVSLREDVQVGDRAIIHNGTVIGSDGYGFVPEIKGGTLVIRKIPQAGSVQIGNDVEIGANVTIDRARFGRTRIGNSVKIDNLVHVAHNVVVGDCTGLVAQVGISGSTRIGSRVVVWGQAGIAGHLTIGDGAQIGARSGVTKDVAAGVHVSGYPAMPHDKARRTHASIMRLPELKQRVEGLEQRLAGLEQRLKTAG